MKKILFLIMAVTLLSSCVELLRNDQMVTLATPSWSTEIKAMNCEDRYNHDLEAMDKSCRYAVNYVRAYERQRGIK